MKRCTLCLRDLPLDCFSKRSNSPDSLAYWCRECMRSYRKAHACRSPFSELPQPLPVSDTDRAWLAGLLDGEGSIGISKNSGGKSLVPAVQLQMTCERTVLHARETIRAIGADGISYAYQSRKIERHKPFWYLRLGRLRDCYIVGSAVVPFSVTKQEHWGLLLDFLSSRLTGRTLNPLRKAMNPHNAVGYKHLTDYEWSIYERLRSLNQRGPARRIEES